MSIPVGYDLSKFAEMGYPQDWLDYFLDWTDDDSEVEVREESQGLKNNDPSLFNISEEQIDDANFWINL